MATIQGVYVALFGRPADPTGLSFFNAATSNGANLNAIGNLASTAEYQARFAGLNNVQIINSVYQSLFGRDAEIAGLNFFVDALNKGTLNINNIAIAILDGAQGNDKTISANKIAAADLYTKALDTGSEVVAYSGLAAAAQGRTFVTGVTTTVPAAAAVDTAVAAMVTASTGGGTGTVGVTLSLTAGADFLSPDQANSAFKTTTGNDTIRAATVGDLATADSIDGGAGTDTLNAAMAVAALSTAAPIVKAVENINLTYGTLAGAVSFDAKDVSGALKIQVIDAVTTGQTYTISNVEKSAAVEFKNITGDAAGDVVVGFRDAAGGSDSATVSFAKVTTGLGITVDAIENLTINSTGATGDTNLATVSAAQATKFIITGANDLTLNGSTAAALKTVDASAFTGKLNYTATTNGETISGGTKADAIVLTGGALADTLVYTAANASTLNNMDTITGFQAGTNVTSVDKIDLKAFALGADTTIGATNLSPAGDTAGFFSGTARIVYNDTTQMAYVDANKDGAFNASTDLAIKLTGVTAANLDKGDFILA